MRTLLILVLGVCLAKEMDAMTCNIARSYNPELQGAVAVFSRVRPDLLFEENDEIAFHVFGEYRPLHAEWTLARNAVNTPFHSGIGEISLDQSVRIAIPADDLKPGFYDVRLTIHATETTRESRKVTFGYRIPEISRVDSTPPDFERFWTEGRSRLAGVPLRAAERFVREMRDPEVSTYNVDHASIPEHVDPDGERFEAIRLFKVQFDSLGGKRMHGWLTVPVGKGPFPGMLVLPGAGVAAVPAPVEHARHGYVSLMLQIHGMDVDRETYETPADYLKIKGGRPENEYYYSVYLACVQAVRYLAERPDVDADRLVVAGGSQGGQLAIVTAALCPEVKAVVSTLCYYADWPLRDQVAELNARRDPGVAAPAPPPFDQGKAGRRNLGYYDPVNFAPRVRGATLMGGSLNDGPSPAPTVYAVYRKLGASRKKLLWSPGTDHDLMIAFERLAWEWVDRETGYSRGD